MNINLSNYYTDSNVVSNSGSNRNEAVDKSIQNQNVQTINAHDNIDGINLRDLSVGDIFHGEIIDINNQNIEILLDGNEHVNATMQQALELNIGEKLLFQVKENNDSRLVIRPVANNNVSDVLVNKSLLTSGLTINDKNVAIVKELIANGQPIDKQSIINMIKLTSIYANESIDKLVDMTKNGIEINPDNLEMYDAYKEAKHYIMENISDISNGLTDALDKLLEDSNQNNASDIVDNTQVNVQNTSDLAYNSGMSLQNGINMENLNKADRILDTLAKIFDGKSDEKSDVRNILENAADNDKAVSQDSIINKDNVISKDSILENNIDSEYDYDKILENAKSFKELAEILKDGYKNMSGMSFNNVIKSPILKNKIIKLLTDKLYLSPDKLGENKDNIKNEIEKVYDKLDKLNEMIKNMPEDIKNDNLTSASEKLSKNLNFMNELNNIEGYVQVPVNFSEGHKTADLYVYNRRKNKKINDDTLTAFLHLQLDYLGATDVNISMKKNNINTQFTLDDEISRKLVEENLDELKDKLEKMGYSVKISTELEEKNEQKSEAFDAMLPVTANNENTISIKRYVFDIRT